MNDTQLKIFNSSDLVPEAWVKNLTSGSAGFRVFNPTILESGDGFVMAYRVVDEESDTRRLATCLLDADFNIIPGSPSPLSDRISFAQEEFLDSRALKWHADPRFFRLFGRVYLLWNDGGNRPFNHQFMVEMDDRGLDPVGLAREVVRPFGRTAIEKNWMFFESEGQVWATYDIDPHVVLAVDMSQPDMITCHLAYEGHWQTDFASVFGILRGSAQAQQYGEDFLSIAHTSFKTPAGRRYVCCAYQFSNRPPFAIKRGPRLILPLQNPQGSKMLMPKLNAEIDQVVYPCGFVIRNDKAVISYGINDELCAVTLLPLTTIEDSLQPTETECIATTRLPLTGDPAPEYRSSELPMRLPLFWWNARGAKMDGSLGKRTFSAGNFGDIASRDIVQQLTGCIVTDPVKGNRKLLCIGSIIHTAGNGDIVWGTGMKGIKMALDPKVKTLSVHAVRGPLTADMLRRHGIRISGIKEFFDPGCLMPVLYKDEISALSTNQIDKPDVRIIPHYKDDLVLRRSHYHLSESFISVDTTPMGMVASIFGAKKIISSSLHGIIFAESLGIPAVWLTSIGGEDELKFYDYYYGTGRFRVVRTTSIDEALAADPMSLPVFNFDSYLATFPHEEIASLITPGFKMPTSISMSNKKMPSPDTFGECHEFELHTDSGLWATGKEARLVSRIIDSSVGEALVTLVLKPFNHPHYKMPQCLEITVNGINAGVIEWSRGSNHEIEFPIILPTIAGCTPLDLIFKSRCARSPKSLGFSEITQRLAVCLHSITISAGRLQIDSK